MRFGYGLSHSCGLWAGSVEKGLTWPKDDGIPDHDIIGTWTSRDTAWRVR